jgi:hypothetical protein
VFPAPLPAGTNQLLCTQLASIAKSMLWQFWTVDPHAPSVTRPLVTPENLNSHYIVRMLSALHLLQLSRPWRSNLPWHSVRAGDWAFHRGDDFDFLAPSSLESLRGKQSETAPTLSQSSWDTGAEAGVLNVGLELLVRKFGTLLGSKGGGWQILGGSQTLSVWVWVPRWAALRTVGLGVAELVVVPSGLETCKRGVLVGVTAGVGDVFCCGGSCCMYQETSVVLRPLIKELTAP